MRLIAALTDEISIRHPSCGGAAADRSSSTATSNSVRVHRLSLHPNVDAGSSR
jgi:hypothetical protein